MKINYPIRNSHEQAYLHSVQGWIKAKNAAQCKRFAEEKGLLKDVDAMPALMELLRLPNGFRKPRPTEEMCQAREAAVHAIAQIGAPDALSCVGMALFNPCSGVRAVASQILHQAGANAAEPLARIMTWRQNWSIEGMRVLLYTLGTSRNPSAGQPLARVLMGELPAVPPRWEKEAFKAISPLIVAEVVFIVALLALLGFYLPGSIAVTVGLTAFFTILDMFAFVPLYNYTVKRERRSLAVAACEALRMLGDKRELGTLMFHLRRSEYDIAQAAYNGVMAILPTINAYDAEWMPLVVRQRLTALLDYRDANLNLAVLRALEFVGTGQAEYPVRRLIERGLTPEIRAEAARIQPILAERLRQEQSSGMLLRASQSPLHAQGELLRPAAASSDTAPQELLRASNGLSE